MHTLILHQHLSSPESIGTGRVIDTARRLAQAGHSVTLVTPAEKLAQSDSDSLRALLDLEGIVIKQLRTTAINPRSTTGKFLQRLIFVMRAIVAGLTAPAPDAILVTGPPLSTVLCGYIIGKIRAAPLMLELWALWPDISIATASLRFPFAIWLARLGEQLAYRSAQCIIALSPGIKEAAIRKGVDEERIRVVPQGCDLEFFREHGNNTEKFLERHSDLATGPLVTYSGPLNRPNDANYVVRVAAEMRDIDPEVRFLMFGNGDDTHNVRALAEHSGVLGENLWILPPPTKADRVTVLKASALTLSIVADSPLLHHYPSECVADALAAGCPIALNHAGWQATLIESRGAGLALPARDPAAASREMSEYLADTDGLRRAREQASALAETRFNADKLAGEHRAALEDMATIYSAQTRRRNRSLFIKRVFDLVISTLALTLTAPVMLAISIAVFVKMGRPVFFLQQRPGWKGQPFRLIKFRTMSSTGDGQGSATTDSERMTPLGQILRKTSLDELPELINVVQGDMSLVGPRPLLMEYLPYYSPEQARRHDVRPGLTGLAQVKGRNALTWEDKFALDVTYVDTRSFWLDLRILLETIPVVWGGKGVAAEGHATMPRFDEIMARRQGAEDES
jgi:lipopolysaccharide/colanic/teichoic acid biosynthesis glycosyltransferase